MSTETFRQRYELTFIRGNFEGRSEVIFIAGIEGGLVEIHTNKSGTSNHKVHYTEGFFKCLNLDMPKIGLFNLSGFALHLFRVPMRQNRQGLCEGNHGLVNPLQYLFSEGILYHPKFMSMKIAVAAYEPQYPASVVDALAELNKANKIASIALSSNVFISKSPTESPYPLIWYRMSPVGHVIDGQIWVKDERYKQELADECIRKGLDFTWKS
jgi:hypothetical protein